MFRIKFISLAICCLPLIVCIYGADKYTDENRPYEFGFTIEGEQHRHEKKDENGIIMGEFGFITADGVYHVTVYATDEQGRFKILSMKNIRVKPYPTAGVKKGHSLPFPPSENAPVLQGPSPSTPQQESKPMQTNKQISSSAKSCSHCSIPTTTTKAPQLTNIAVVSRDRPPQGNFGPQGGNVGQVSPASGLQRQNVPASQNFGQPNAQRDTFGGQQNYAQQEQDSGKNYQQQGFSGQPNYPSQESNINNASPNLPEQGNNQYYPQNGNIANNDGGSQSSTPSRNNANQYYPQELPKVTGQDIPNANQNYPQQHSDNVYVPQGSIIQAQPEQNSFEQHNSFGKTGVDNSQPPQGGTLRNPKQYSDISPSNYGDTQSQGFGAILASQTDRPVSNKPTLVAAQMQIVPKDTDIYHKRPGEKDGLPNGLSESDMSQLLYTFNYTVGFHGHHEEGYINGAKQGYYYVTGRNGIRTRVDYVADEKGFRPKISQEVLDLLSDDVPKPETEKEERFGLKGYEFKWLYYPTEAKKQ
ncbi:uncharacterized protein l(3)mbn [Epargyreus clarus]|uniref:uncharacterized protein l(3)mbn n=1 Tax=Epargyreus clarus TaxID=520877 RepID=UPI003C2D3B1D